jgi:hypothetical protein
MNRIEIVGLFSALEALHESKQYDKMGKVIKDVLLEAREKSAVKPDNKDNKGDDK